MQPPDGDKDLHHHGLRQELALAGRQPLLEAPAEEVAMPGQARDDVGAGTVAEDPEEVAGVGVVSDVQLPQDAQVEPRPLGAGGLALLELVRAEGDPSAGHPFHRDEATPVQPAPHHVHGAVVPQGVLQVPDHAKGSLGPRSHANCELVHGLLQLRLEYGHEVFDAARQGHVAGGGPFPEGIHLAPGVAASGGRLRREGAAAELQEGPPLEDHGPARAAPAPRGPRCPARRP
mmetsp:Transcript_115737/g.373968  ORF Transcript_115737/g.373968 Transcript_115737/m.373968 type:complete len:232 (+) Transcript_115737:683-1378(+)